MDLLSIASPFTAIVSPFVTATVQTSTGYATAADGTQVPSYSTATFQVQPQPLAYTDLTQLDGLSIQGVRRAIYANNADIEGVVRVDSRGGDLLTFPPGTFPEGNVWKAVLVLEHWQDWVKVAVVLQGS